MEKLIKPLLRLGLVVALVTVLAQPLTKASPELNNSTEQVPAMVQTETVVANEPSPQKVQEPQPEPPKPVVPEKKKPAVKPTGTKTEWMTQAGIPEHEWAAVTYIVQKESSWNYSATNRSSGAFGLCQSLPATKMASAGGDYRTNPVTQLKWCHSYAYSRYGGWWNAYNFWQKNTWW